MGEISLRRRWVPLIGAEVYEIKLDDEFLMSSMFTVAEIELAHLALAAVRGAPLDVAVGGLGLGFTALAVLDDPRVREVVVIEALGEVIEWHERGLIPAGTTLGSDHRCRLIHGDFFKLASSSSGLDPRTPHRRFHAIVVDIDHSPRHLLNPEHASFYEPAGLSRLAEQLHPGGVFALWSNDPPDDEFRAALADIFVTVAVETVSFHNPLQERTAANTVYVATTATHSPGG